MRVAVGLVALVAAAAAAAPLAPLLKAPTASDAVAGKYMVVLRSNATVAERDAHIEAMLAAVGPGAMEVTFRYAMHSFRAYAAKLGSQAAVDTVRAHPDVSYVEEVQFYYVNRPLSTSVAAPCTTQEMATWGLVRTNERTLRITGEYSYPNDAGLGVFAYVLDTGILLEHVDFEGRAVWGTDTVDKPSDKTDLHGHGTHVAGTVGSHTFGEAKSATLVAVKVLGRDGYGDTSTVTAGIQWASEDHDDKKAPGVINMSLGGGLSSALNQAVDACVRGGLAVVAAAGNENTNACTKSPASAPLAYTVAATDDKDSRASYSNYGTCVDIFAPGSAITSTYIGSIYSIATMSGTSMASPHVAGIVAKFLSANPSATPDEIASHLTKSATPNVVSGPQGSPNLLVYAGCP